MKLTLLLAATLAASATAGALATTIILPVEAGQPQARTTLTLTHDWRFQRGDLPYNGGPVLCADDLTAAFPSDLTGKECAMGPTHSSWSMITSGAVGESYVNEHLSAKIYRGQIPVDFLHF